MGRDGEHTQSYIVNMCCNMFSPEIRAVPLINPGRVGFEELKVHFLMEKDQQQKERLLKDYLMLIEIPVIGLGYDATRIINAARYSTACQCTTV